MDHGRLQQQFDALWREHRGIVTKVARMYARSAEDRADLVQEIAAQLWRAFPKFDERRAKFSTWLYRIALNVAISNLRRAGGDPARTESLEAAQVETLPAPASELPDERIQALQVWIAELDPFNRALILLHLEDRSYAEIAEVLGISTTNVATKLNRIKQRWRAGLADRAPATSA